MTGPTLAPSPLTFGMIRDYLAERYKNAGIKTRVEPGPHADSQLQKLGPDRIVFIHVGGGAGLHLEGTFDRPFITVRMIGKQGDYEDAETLALFTDDALLGVDGSQWLGLAYMLGINRTGGRPELLLKDNANRYHFTGSYVADAATGR